MMDVYIFILGLILGSFYNVVGLRVPQKQSIVTPRSHCTKCKRTLTALDLIPFFSYVFLRGKCRGCQTKFSPIYPLMELATGLLLLLSYLYFGFTWELAVALLFMSMLVIITVTDISYMLIPDKILLVFAPLFVLLRVFLAPLDPWWDMFVGAGVGFGLLLLIAFVSKGGMGGGDIKLYAVLGLVLGLQNVLLSFFLATFFGALFGAVGMLLGKVKRGKPMAFGPYIVLGTIIAYFYGDLLINWYLQFL
ncbi:prepilin peptidase [Bacillus alkalicellulosilyticus]|uniref:prepilin peptidase n=1 Tax=Alkalihalobacterium alkalicellulosilyticum TaxID=1912214 RepID=UPI0009989417|nr:A24 family peptidase [Bacillus alkalicellulosilyticus]